MDPYQQQPQTNQYDFITNSPPPPRQPIVGGSMQSRIILVVGGLFAVLLLIWVVSTMLSSGGRQAEANLKAVAAEQQEIIRVSNLATTGSINSDTKGYAATINLVMTSSQSELSELLLSRGIKLTRAEQDSRLNSKTEETLKSATANNRYDETITDILNDLLSQHMQTVKKAYDSNDSTLVKEALEKNYESVDILLNAKNIGT